MEKSNIKVLEEGFINEGEYNNIKVLGECEGIGNIKAKKVNILGYANFNGDIEFEVLKVNGITYIEGNFTCNELKVNGDLTINGKCDINTLVVNGELKSIYNMKCNNVTIRGSLNCNKNITSQYIKSYGDLKVKENIESEIVSIEGKIVCEGLLNAEEVVITPRGRCKCNEIGASIIDVTNPKGIFRNNLFFGRVGSMDCNLIEGDTISLIYSNVKNVRGKSVKIIDQCKIENIEYNDLLEVSPNSTVKSSSKVG